MVLALFSMRSRLSPIRGEGFVRSHVIDAARTRRIDREGAVGGPCRIVPSPSSGDTRRRTDERQVVRGASCAKCALRNLREACMRKFSNLTLAITFFAAASAHAA